MRLLILILLFPFFSYSQFGAGVAQVGSESAIKFGALVNSSSLTPSQKAGIAKDTLSLCWVRSAISIDTWTGSDARTETNQAAGLRQLVVIAYSSAQPAPFPTSAQLAAYQTTLRAILTKYPYIWGIVIENEEINPSYHTGPLSRYVAEVAAAYAVAHPLGIKVFDGGTYGVGQEIKVYRYLQVAYDQATADQFGAACMGNAEINAAKNPGLNPPLDALANQIDTVLTAVNSVDGFNVHLYEPAGQNNNRPDTVTQIALNDARYTKEFYEHATVPRKMCIMNETAQRNNTQPTLVTNMWNNYTRIGFQTAQVFDGTGAAGAEPITDDNTGAILPNGTAFKNVVTSNQCACPQQGKTYYFSTSAGNDGRSSTQAQNPSTPWKTITKLNSFFTSLQPGDKVLFNGGEIFLCPTNNHLNITKSGISGKQITIGSYGTGQATFEYNVATATAPLPQRAIIYAAAGISYITISNINFTDPTMNSTTIHTALTANTAIAVDFDGTTTVPCNNITIANCTVSLLGNGFEIHGNNTNFQHNSIQEMGGVVNKTQSQGGAGNYGAQAVVFSGSNGMYNYNFIKNCYYPDQDIIDNHPYEGAAFELVGAVAGQTSNNQFYYNTVIRSCTLCEAGSSTTTDVADNNTFAYNLLIDNGNIFTLHNSGSFSMVCSNFNLYNCDISETGTAPYQAANLFGSTTTTSANTVITKNDIYWVSTSLTVIKNTYTASGFIHTNNIYHMLSGSLGFTIGGTELNADPLFVSTTGNPQTWNYNLQGTSPAIGFGTSLGFSVDLAGHAVTNPPDVGCYQVVLP